MTQWKKTPGAEAPQGIQRTNQQFWSFTRSMAAGAAWSLAEGWKRTRRPNHSIERLALWYTVLLDQQCQEVASAIGSQRLAAVEAPAESRYEVTAAIEIIPRVVPFASSRAALRQPREATFESWGEELAREEPEVVADWHRWLRPEGVVQDRGDASLLGIACMRLAVALGEDSWHVR